MNFVSSHIQPAPATSDWWRKLRGKFINQIIHSMKFASPRPASSHFKMVNSSCIHHVWNGIKRGKRCHRRRRPNKVKKLSLRNDWKVFKLFAFIYSGDDNDSMKFSEHFSRREENDLPSIEFNRNSRLSATEIEFEPDVVVSAPHPPSSREMDRRERKDSGEYFCARDFH